MSRKEQQEQRRDLVRELVEEIKATGKKPTKRELMERTGANENFCQETMTIVNAYIQKGKVAISISQANTGIIPGVEPIGSLDDISKQEASE